MKNGITFKVGSKVRVKPQYSSKYRVTNSDMIEAKILGTSSYYFDDDTYAYIEVLKHKNKSYIGNCTIIKLSELELISQETEEKHKEMETTKNKPNNMASNVQENTSINIRPTGNNFTGMMIRDGNILTSSTSTCCPEDKFDYSLGATIAFARLFGEQKFFENAELFKKEYEAMQKMKKEAKKRAEIPVLVKHYNDKVYVEELGKIGTPVPLSDINNEPLYVGDIVNIYDKCLNLVIENTVVIEKRQNIFKIYGIDNLNDYHIVKQNKNYFKVIPRFLKNIGCNNNTNNVYFTAE